MICKLAAYVNGHLFFAAPCAVTYKKTRKAAK
jgi:hypothetical protein